MSIKISDICDINSSNISSKDNYEFINYLDTSNLTEGVIDTLQKLVVGEDKIPSRAKRKVKKNDVLISTVRPNQKHYGILRKLKENLIVSTGFVVLSAKEDIVDAEYLYRYLTQDSITNYLQAIGETSTSAYPSIKPSDIGSLEIELPQLEEQKAIAKVLSDLDEKIETNNKINKKLEEMSQAIFKQWFVDFEFPNEDGKPYKSSGGEMYESEKGLIPKDFEVSNLGEFFNVITGKENANFAKKNGEYKYFTCSQKDFMCDEFAFDGKALLLAGNGDFSLKWYNGKFNAYQRTYVLQPFKEHTFEYLYLTMNNYLKYITQGSQGSVIKFLTKGMIANYKIIYNDDLVDKFNKIISSIFIKQENINREIEKLSEIRDILLPKLMSDEIRVPID